MKRALVLVEGQTEEAFVKSVLQEYFGASLSIAATRLVTRRVRAGGSFRGGVTNFARFENDVQRLLYQAGDALVTTMLDYYGLPRDFPGMSDRPAGNPLARARHVEAAIHSHFGQPGNFLPYLSLHEFEALLFSSPDVLPRIMTQPGRVADFAAIRAEVATPEDINDRPEYAPSRRIQALFPGYQKTLYGPSICKEIGLAQLRAACPHFHAWIQCLETFARGS